MNNRTIKLQAQRELEAIFGKESYTSTMIREAMFEELHEVVIWGDDNAKLFLKLCKKYSIARDALYDYKNGCYIIVEEGFINE